MKADQEPILEVLRVSPSTKFVVIVRQNTLTVELKISNAPVIKGNYFLQKHLTFNAIKCA